MSLEANISGVTPFTPAETQSRAEATAVASTLGEQRRESAFRLVMVGLTLLIGFISEFGTAWDIQWHLEVGRDNFWTTPHWLLYTSVGATGLLALGMILFETWRYHRGSRVVTDKTTTPFFGFFHAPFGFYLLGFGILGTVIAAPFDDYWHQLYGIDVAIWTPFHMMGIIGGIFAGVGGAYCFASEYNRSQKRAAQLSAEGASLRVERIFTAVALLGLALATSRLMGQALLLVVESVPGNRWNIGDWKPLMFPSLIALALPGFMIAAVVATGRPGIATLSALGLTFSRWYLALTVPGVTDSLVKSEGLTKRAGAESLGLPRTIFVPESYPAWIILAGLIIDLGFVFTVWLWSRRQSGRSFRAVLNFSYFQPQPDKNLLSWALSFWPMLFSGILAAIVLVLTTQPYMEFYNAVKRIAPTLRLLGGEEGRRFVDEYLSNPPNLLAAMPLVLLGAVLSVILGRYLGFLLRYTYK